MWTDLIINRCTQLPNDFHSHWLQNIIYELFHYIKLTKFFDKEGYYIRIYEYRTNNGKYAKIYTLKYNTMISSYEINTTRYADYGQALKVMWNLEKNPPL
jgi:hypothetical protein